MGQAKQFLEEQLQQELELSFECASCSVMIPLDPDFYESISELKKDARALERELALCESCRAREQD